MTVADALRGARRVFLDTAPVVYLIEKNPRYLATMQVVGDLYEARRFVAVTSPITLLECLVIPIRLGDPALQQRFVNTIAHGENTVFAQIDEGVAIEAAAMRAKHGMRLADALQVAVAIREGCDTFLTNDTAFRRVSEIKVVLVDDVEVG
jgi:predicted nucleic acid-binding protein